MSILSDWPVCGERRGHHIFSIKLLSLKARDDELVKCDCGKRIATVGELKSPEIEIEGELRL